MSFNVGFRPVNFGNQTPKSPQPLAGKIAPPTPEKLPTEKNPVPTPLAGLIAPPQLPPGWKPSNVPKPPLAGIIAAPPKPNNQPSHPIPRPTAGIISPPDEKLPNPITIIENIKKPE